MKVFLVYIYNPDSKFHDQLLGVYNNLEILNDDIQKIKELNKIEVENEELVRIIETKLNNNNLL